MDSNNKLKYSKWKNSNTSTHAKPHQNFSSRYESYDPQRYSSTTRLQSSLNTNSASINKPSVATRSKYNVDLNRLLQDKTKPFSSSNISQNTSNTISSSSLLSHNTNITTRRFQSNDAHQTLAVPLSTTQNIHSNKHIIDYRKSNNNHKSSRTEHKTPPHNDTNLDMKENIAETPSIITDKLKRFNLSTNSNSNNLSTNTNNNNNKFMISSKSNNILLNKHNQDSSTKRIATRSNDTQYNLSLIRPNDRVVLYSSVAHCYVCLSDFEEHSMDTLYDDEYNEDSKEENDNNALYLKCDDMEGVPLLIGETQFCGTCKFLADCKIQLITGQGLYKDRNRIIIHSKHTTKFMLQKYDHLGDTGSMAIGHRVLIFVEASRSNRKLFWSYCSDTESIILKECDDKPSDNEIFVLQKYGQPLEWRAKEDLHDTYTKNKYVLDNFFAASGGDNANVQEFYLCHDILRVLSRNDFDGDFIHFTHDAVYGFPRVIFNGAKYGISTLLQSAVDALTIFIEDTAKVRHFVSIHCRAEYGVVSQAFCFSVDKHLKDFNILLVQLETRLNRNELTLQNMRFYLQRACRTMNALRRICCDIHLNKEKKMNSNSKSIYVGSRGGALLNMIQKHIDISGEKHVVILYNKLLKAAQKPYFNMLSNWIYRGIITDIYNEFMIKEKTHLKKEDLCIEYNNEYWTGRYSLNHVQIPLILYDYMDIIVTTGKYLNVMRESGYLNDLSPSNTNIQILDKCTAREIGECINDQYNFASKALLGMLMNRERIMYRFKSVGKFMLLQCGDWFCYFMDMAQSILLKNAGDIKKTKLDRLLELSFRTSNTSKNDPFKDDVCCDIKNSDLNTMMIMLHDIRSGNGTNNSVKESSKEMQNNLMRLSGIEAFALNYTVEWPASIIFTGRNLIRYQLIFRFLFKLKFVARQLKNSWKQQMSLRELDLHHTHNKSLMLRHRMLSFVDSLLFYISYQVIDPNWNQFIQNTLNTIKTVDSLLSAQETFLTTTLEQCLLTHKQTIQLLFKILVCCQQYTNFIKRYTSDWKIHDMTKKNNKQQERKTAINMIAQDCRGNLLSSNFTNSIEKYTKSFEESVRSFLNNLQKSNYSNINVNVLLARLDYNAYYMPKLLSF